MELQAIRIPLAKQLQKGFTDAVSTTKGYMGILANYEKSFGVKGAPSTFGSIDVFPEIQNNFRLSQPKAEGFDWNNPDVAGMAGPPKHATKVIGAKQKDPAGYRIPSETISEGLVKKMETDPATSMFLMEHYTGMRDAFFVALEEDAFPTSNELAPTVVGGIDGRDSMTRILAFGHALQSGYVANSLTPDASVFNYLDVNFNDAANQGLKALTVGSVPTAQQTGLGIASSPFGTPGNSNLRKKILFPLNKRKNVVGDMNLVFTDSDVYDYLVNDPESKEIKTQMKAMETFSYGGLFRILPDGNMVFYLDNMQSLYAVTGVHKMYFMPPGEIFWGMSDQLPTVDIIPIPFNPGFSNLQSVAWFRHLLRNARKGALAYGVQI